MFSSEDIWNHPKKEKLIAEHLSEKHNFDLVGALQEGYSLHEVIDHLNVKESTQDAHLELVMCPPQFLSTAINNNKWMKDMSGEDKEINVDKAMAQFFNLYSLLAQDAIVYLLPPKRGLQDQVYISNAGMVLPHLYKTIVLANFKAPGRPGEETALSQFIDLMEFSQYSPPAHFEGEAEMKWLRDNIYICGHGMRSDIESFKWMEKTLGCHNIYIKEKDALRYHLDCQVFPINGQTVLLATDMVEPHALKEIESVAEIIPVSVKDSQFSITNAVRVGSVIYLNTDISELDHNHKDYLPEKHKNETMEKICRDQGLSLVWIDMSELGKSGASLSCCVCHLSYIAYPGN